MEVLGKGRNAFINSNRPFICLCNSGSFQFWTVKFYAVIIDVSNNVPGIAALQRHALTLLCV